jgi:hypothetical protein
MSTFPKQLISACAVLVLAGTALSNPARRGFVEGHLTIVSRNEVELADGTPDNVTAETYAEYPLIVLSHDGKKEIARVAADEKGNYRLALPPGDYILDVQGRTPKGHVRTKPQRFTVASNRITRVDMGVDTGVR